MLYTGKNIRESHIEKLESIEPEALAERIRYPEKDLLLLTERIQKAMAISTKAGQALKLLLPYFTGAGFSGNIRHSQNFLSIRWFVLDLDHCIQSISDENDLKSKLKTDPQIFMMYISPSGAGLKILFYLEPEISNTKYYSDFYLAFARQFGTKHGVEEYIDFKTHDVTRVSFLSVDPMLYYNAGATAVCPSDYLPLLKDPIYDINPDAVEKRQETENPENCDTKPELDDDIYRKILKTINPAVPVRKKDYFVPKILEKLIMPIKEATSAHGLMINNISDIQYGKKFNFKLGEGMAEINIYYGKNGFSVVKTPKKNTVPELNEIAYQIAMNVIHKLLRTEDIRNLAGQINNSQLN
jgi:hypothetical protein